MDRGFTVWLGVTISQMISLTVLLVFAVGIADCVHVMSAYFSFRRQGDDHYDALSKSYGKTGLAIMVTTITTMAGVLALTTSELVPIRVFGMMYGVVMAFFFTLVLLPILLDLWHPGAPAADDASLADRLGDRWNRLSNSTKTGTALVYVVGVYLMLGPWVGTYITVISLLTYVVVNWQLAILSGTKLCGTTTLAGAERIRRPVRALLLWHDADSHRLQHDRTHQRRQRHSGRL